MRTKIANLSYHMSEVDRWLPRCRDAFCRYRLSPAFFMRIVRQKLICLDAYFNIAVSMNSVSLEPGKKIGGGKKNSVEILMPTGDEPFHILSSHNFLLHHCP